MTAPPMLDFDALLAGSEEPAEEQPAKTTGRGAIVMSIAALAVGGMVLSGAVLLAHVPERPPRAFAAKPTVEAAAPVAEYPVPEPEPVSPRKQPISELVDQDWVRSLSSRTGIPLRPLAAYTGAAVKIAEESPGCGLGWNTLAGIGFVESEHGAIHGSAITENGDAQPGIVGIALTGGTTQSIPDTDGGALDGDAVWDRAVGPMQFLPSTWDQWGSDGNGDGIADPQNIDDAALSAGRYLCYAGGDLKDAQSWIAAVHAYNPTVEYNNLVADAASHYAAQ